MYPILSGVLLLAIYLFIIILKIHKIPTSISETWYLGGEHWFTIVLFIAAILVAIGMLDISEGTYWLFLAFFTSAGMLFVGAAPEFHDNYIAKIHYSAAITLFTASQLWIFLVIGFYPLLIWLLFPLWIKLKSKMFWCEMTCITSICLSLLFL